MSKIVFLGDIYMTQPVRVTQELPDNLVVNLEGPLFCSPTPALNRINLANERDSFWNLFEGKLLAACLANNHIFDFGSEGFERTIDDLHTHGVRYFGAGTSNRNFNNPILVNCAGVSVGLAGYCCDSTTPSSDESGGLRVAPIDAENIARDLTRMVDMGATLRVLIFHWGAQDISLPKPDDRQMAMRVLAMGADLLVGHHAHCIQSIEKRGDWAVFYGLGNTIMDDVDVMAFFGDSTPYGKPFKKRNKNENLESLAVELDVKTNVTNTKRFKFSNRILSQASDRKLHVNPIVLKARILHKLIFALKFASKQLVPRVRRVLRGRQAISLATIRNALRVLFPKVYK